MAEHLVVASAVADKEGERDGMKRRAWDRRYASILVSKERWSRG
jgi:hypothetical protein